MSRVILNLPRDLRVSQLDALLMGLANANGCRIVQSTDHFGNRSYMLEPVYQAPAKRNVIQWPKPPPMWPKPSGPECAA